ncbi:hypothetical protein HUE87_03965 [Candidatus Sulfurimonas marisnigri]|uniref:Uncharacterized protein n=1 Tax=Candidatus Sulfurimonas marisnigri TaxID=2740405 RepID=A0A7S7M1G8_9BACT|nr:hypothetical protein [Candidatus Sulfurimonas marisnigri]QOY55401.1 hypothetical protein HUE87_03965 [Candidatus Sulfurimonas marisnigri]
MNKDKQIKKILDDLVTTIKDLSRKQKDILNKVYTSTNNKNINRTELSKEDKEFYKDLVTIVVTDSDNKENDIQVLLDGNTVAIELYKQNTKTYNELLKYALNVYELYDNIKVPYLDEVKVNVISTKEFITADEFTLLYGYSKSWQTNRRNRVHNRLEKSSKDGCKIQYNANELRKWFDNEFNR